MRPLSLILGLALCGGCATLTMPEHVTKRKPFTSFNPAGRWRAEGEFFHRSSSGTVIDVKAPEAGGQFFRVTRYEARKQPLHGDGLVENDVLYVVWGAANFALYNVGNVGEDKVLEGLFGSDKIGYERGTGEADYGDGFSGAWEINGINPSGSQYSGELKVSKEGDHYSVYSKSGDSTFDGAGIKFNDRLVCGFINSYKHVENTSSWSTTTQEAVFPIGAYKWDGSKLVGVSLVTSTRWDDRTAAFQEKQQPETWSRVDAK